ncbi:MAG: GTPase HflX [Planctomycetota bacterium]|nr:GTPase HflX [Planctomycetota bacterium]
MMHDPNEAPKRAIVVAVQLSSVNDFEFEASVTELRQLAKTLGFEIVGTFTQKRRTFDPGAYVGKGKRQEIRRFVRNEFDPAHDASSDIEEGEVDIDDQVEGGPSAAETKAAEETPLDPATLRADLILVDHEISPSQARNLETQIGCAVMDRTMVILEIFHRHARSRAARAQVEIVRLAYMAPRLRETAKLAGPKGRQRSGIGGRGAGEAQDEIDRRKIRDRINELQEELVAMEAERKTQRTRRQESQGLAHVALVGYTNAGKSTLMRALTGSEVLVADKLFATLDTTVRVLQPEGIPRVLVSDTVGFIKNLPHGLVASFKSTLDEALEASLLAHVIDASDPGLERQLAVTEEVLDEIGAMSVPRILVFNKIDRVGDEAMQAEREAALRAQHPDCIVMSAHRADDVVKLRDALNAFFRRRMVEAELFLPWSAQQMRGDIFAACEVLEERADSEGAFFRVLGERETVKRLNDQLGRLPTTGKG